MSKYDRLFNILADEKLIMTESELDEVAYSVLKVIPAITQAESDKVFDTITSNECREMTKGRFNQAVNEIICKIKKGVIA